MSEVVVTPVVSPSNAPSVKEVQMTPSPVSSAAEPLVAPVEPQPGNEAQAESKPEPKLGKRFAELARREKELLQKAEAVKEVEARVSPLEQARNEKDFRKRLAAVGLTYDELTDYILNAPEDGEESEAPAKSVEELVDERLEAKRQADEAAERQARGEARLTELRESIKAEAASNDAYELVHTTSSYDLVFDVILGHHAETGAVLPIDQALKSVEAHLESEARKLTQTKKIGGNATQASPVKPEPKANFTLSNVAAPTSVSSSTPMTREQAREAAVAALRFK